MQINNNSNSQTNFRAVVWENALRNGVKKNVKEVLSERLTSGQFTSFVENVEKRFGDSPLTLQIGLADSFGDRLDAQIFHKDSEKAFEYLHEKRFNNLLNINPLGFLKKVEDTFVATEKKLGF